MARKTKAAIASGEATEGFTKLVAPEDTNSCSVDGHQYDVEDDGTVEVPDEHVAELVCHGFKKA